MLLVIGHGQPEHEVDNDSSKQGQGEDGRTEPVVEAALAPHPYALCAPVECEEGVDHGHHGNDGEQAGANLSHLVAEVEKTDSQAAQDDGEVEP